MLCARHGVIHQRACHQLSLIVVNNFFIHRLPNRLNDATVDLPIDQHRIDHFAAVIDSDVAQKLDVACFAINFDDSDVRAEWKGKVLWFEEVSGRQTRLSVRRQLPREVRSERDLLQCQTRLAFRLRLGQCASGRLTDRMHWFRLTGGTGRRGCLNRILSTFKREA